MEKNNIHKLETSRIVLIVVGVVVAVLVIVQIGISLGYRKARFAGQFGSNFERNYLGPRGGMGGMMGFYGQEIPGGHGAVGEIASVSLPEIVIAGPDNLEKTIVVSTSTLIRQFREDVLPTDLKIGDYVVVLGNPNDVGQIEASLIRVMPAPEERMNNFNK